MKKNNAINSVTGKYLKELHKSLNEDKGQCMSVCIGSSEFGSYNFYIVIGWSGGWDKNEYKLCWKVALQPFCAGMQTDFDMDFQFPYNEETGETYDNSEILEEQKTMKDWDKVAAKIRKEARCFLKYWTKSVEKYQDMV